MNMWSIEKTRYCNRILPIVARSSSEASEIHALSLYDIGVIIEQGRSLTTFYKERRVN